MNIARKTIRGHGDVNGSMGACGAPRPSSSLGRGPLFYLTFALIKKDAAFGFT